MNRFDRCGNLTGESVTYGGGAGARWERKGSLYALKSPLVASKVKPGEFLSWHQGVQTDFQVYFGHIQSSPYTYAPIAASSLLEYYEGFEKKSVLITAAEHAGPSENGHLYALTLEDPLPETKSKGALLAAACWEPDTYTCVKSTFINIAGAGHLLRADNVLLEGPECGGGNSPH